MLLHKRNILFNFSIILKHHSDSKLTKVTGIDFAAPRSLQREGRKERREKRNSGTLELETTTNETLFPSFRVFVHQRFLWPAR